MPRRNSKFPHVSLYQARGSYRLTTRTIDGRRITRRLGVVKGNAERYAAKVSDWIDQWISGLIPTPKLLQLIGETVAVNVAIDRYQTELRSKGRNASYIATTIPRLRKLLDLADCTRVGHINQRAIERALGTLRTEGMEGKAVSDQTIRHYARAVMQFSRWCWRKQNWLERDPLLGLESQKVQTIVRQRREPTAEELQLLISHVEQMAQARHNLLGIDRAMLYAFAVATGLRAGELREVRANWVDLEKGLITVPGAHTKNSQDAIQPLPAWLIAKAKTWILVKGDRKLWPAMSVQAAVTLKADQAAARAAWIAAAGDDLEERKRREQSDTLKYKTDAGYFDFHSFRHAYVSRIVNAGANVKDAMSLARHSSAELTIGRYSHAQADSLRKHVDAAIEDPFAGKERAL